MFVLKLFDEELLKFEVVENISNPVVRIEWINKDAESLLPLGMPISDDGVAQWLKHRANVVFW